MIRRPSYRRQFLRPVLAALVPLLISLPAAAQSALDGIMAKKQIQIAIPTDFPPYGFVGTDLKPRAWTSTWPTTSAPSWAWRWSWCR
jgi:hypothetical protein